MRRRAQFGDGLSTFTGECPDSGQRSCASGHRDRLRVHDSLYVQYRRWALKMLILNCGLDRSVQNCRFCIGSDRGYR
jgi:hypothetical protein